MGWTGLDWAERHRLMDRWIDGDQFQGLLCICLYVCIYVCMSEMEWAGLGWAGPMRFFIYIYIYIYTYIYIMSYYIILYRIYIVLRWDVREKQGRRGGKEEVSEKGKRKKEKRRSSWIFLCLWNLPCMHACMDEIPISLSGGLGQWRVG